jgi:hypothetical protein
MKGYEICIRIEDCQHGRNTFLYADEKKQVRSIADENALVYLSSEERWAGTLEGTLEGTIEKGSDIVVLDKSSRMLEWNGFPLKGKIKYVNEVEIEKEVKKDQGIVGVNRPAFKPCTLN